MKCALPKIFYYGVALLLTLLLVSYSIVAKPFNVATTISIDAIEGNGLDLRDIVFKIDSLFENKSSYLVEIGSAVLPDDKGHIKNMSLKCHDGIVSKQTIECKDGEISFEDPLASATRAPVTFYKSKTGDIELSLNNFTLADGSANVDVELKDGLWRARIDSANISFQKLQELLPSFPSFFSQGVMKKSDITFTGKEASIESVRGELYIEKFAFSNEDSTVVGEEVAANIKLFSQRRERICRIEINATTYQGELYFDPVFIDANESPKDLYGVVSLDMDANTVALAPLHYQDSSALHLEVTTVIDYLNKVAISPIQADVKYAFFPSVYEDYMQPFLLDSNIADLDAKGEFSGLILLDGKRIIETDLIMNNLSFSDKQDRFSIERLKGSFGWGPSYVGKDYEFSFDSADIYKIHLDGSQFQFSNNEQALVLNKPVSVPMLDGAINIESFKVLHPGKKEQSISMDISLKPVAMSKLSTAFGWPEMNGNLAGYAPNVTYKQGDLDVQGALLIRGFGGSTTIHNLSASDLFSITPKLSADIQLNNLDLSSLTETFSFGEITGRLDGSINNLQFVSWAPVEFDAWFGTPDKDKSKHRISQTAVDNLTQVGNGGANILSKSFLRFFDSFRYDKLGLGCTLKNNTCLMRGVKEGGTGTTENFYIVKGSGLPRIDIVGFTNKVSWPVLISRLKTVVNTDEVIVK